MRPVWPGQLVAAEVCKALLWLCAALDAGRLWGPPKWQLLCVHALATPCLGRPPQAPAACIGSASMLEAVRLILCHSGWVLTCCSFALLQVLTGRNAVLARRPNCEVYAWCGCSY